MSIPRSEALAIAYFGRTDNVRAHADMNTLSQQNQAKTIILLLEKETIHVSMNHQGSNIITPGASTVA